MKKGRLLLLLCCSAVLSACVKEIPKDALQLSQESMEFRQLQTRKFDTDDESKLLLASTALLQDLGFNIEESTGKLGVIVGSKMREADQVNPVAVAAVVIAIGIGAAFVPWETEQKMRVSLVTRPVEEGKRTAVRVTFQRIIYNTYKEISQQEAIIDPEVYQEFFAKLSKSLFLEAQQL